QGSAGSRSLAGATGGVRGSAVSASPGASVTSALVAGGVSGSAVSCSPRATWASTSLTGGTRGSLGPFCRESPTSAGSLGMRAAAGSGLGARITGGGGEAVTGPSAGAARMGWRRAPTITAVARITIPAAATRTRRCMRSFRVGRAVGATVGAQIVLVALVLEVADGAGVVHAEGVVVARAVADPVAVRDHGGE